MYKSAFQLAMFTTCLLFFFLIRFFVTYFGHFYDTFDFVLGTHISPEPWFSCTYLHLIGNNGNSIILYLPFTLYLYICTHRIHVNCRSSTFEV